ncbi:MAG: hypothetical protein M5R36_11995 [Deltaproteobacteria bacterium]|nr:hypothetical protein [Deltaproteobacteria bacterium]
MPTIFLYHGQASIALGPDGNPHIAYVNLNDADLRYAHKSDGTWTDEAAVTVGDLGQYTGIAVDPSGYAHIVCQSVIYFGAYVLYATNKPGTWTTMVPSGDGRHPSVATDAQGNAHIAVMLASSSIWHRLQYITDKSGTWTSKNVGAKGSGWDPSIIVDASGAVHIADEVVFPADPYEIVGPGYFTNASGTWTTDMAFERRDYDDHYALALDAAGKPRFVYYIYYNQLTTLFATRESGTWVSATLDTGADNGRGTWWGMDDAGGQQVIYANHDSHYEYGYRPSATENWTYEFILSDFFAPATPYNKWFVVDGAGIGHFAFSDNSRCVYATNESGTWAGWNIDEFPSGGASGRHLDVHHSGLEAMSFLQYEVGLYVGTSSDGSLWNFELVDPLAEYRDVTWIAFGPGGDIHVAYSRPDGIAYAGNASGGMECRDR